MIRSRNDYIFYLQADKIALDRSGRPGLVGDDVWKFQRILRKVEYFMNCKKSFRWRVAYWFALFRLYRLAIRLGFTIPPNSCGPGLCIVHRGPIVIARGTKLGANCRIHICVNVGNNVYIGPGAKIYGDIEIADNIAIGANSVVNQSFTEPGISIAGIPAKRISQKGSKGLLIQATDHFVS